MDDPIKGTSKKIGRPKINDQEKRINTNVWLKKGDYDRLKNKAKDCNKTYSSYCESIILSKKIDVRSTDLRLLIAEVNRIGNNINQIARQLNLTSSVNFDEQKQQELAKTILVELNQIKSIITQNGF
jgi:NADH:ubiquinone oxidoreductase subunit D